MIRGLLKLLLLIVVVAVAAGSYSAWRAVAACEPAMNPATPSAPRA